MKKICLSLLVFLILSPVFGDGCIPEWKSCYTRNFWSGSYYGEFKIDDTIKAKWGNPKIGSNVIETNGDTGDFRLKEGWAWPKGPNGGAPATKDEDDQAIIAWIAHGITEHGAEFCLTQISVSSDTPYEITFSKPNNPELQCAWFCEMGWDGYACQTKTDNNVGDYACDNTNYKTTIESLKSRGSGAAAYTGTDAIRNIAQCNNNTCVGALASPVAMRVIKFDHKKLTSQAKEHRQAIVLGIVGHDGFGDEGHGVSVQPILLSAAGGHTGASGDGRTLLITAPAASGTTKTLCAQGYTRLNGARKCQMSSNNCSAGTVWCDASWKDSYESNSGVQEKYLASEGCYRARCKDPNKLYWGNKSGRGKCTESCNTFTDNVCRNPAKNSYGKCIECSVGQYADIDDCYCKSATRTMGKDQLEYGDVTTNPSKERCWGLSGTDYITCVLGANNGSSSEE